MIDLEDRLSPTGYVALSWLRAKKGELVDVKSKDGSSYSGTVGDLSPQGAYLWTLDNQKVWIAYDMVSQVGS